jgi:hypothetical protein
MIGGMNLVPSQLRVALEVTDAMILESKARYRGLVLEQLLEIMHTCEAADAGDPRWTKLRLDALDRIMRLLKLDQPMPASGEPVSGDMADRERTVARIEAELLGLEQRMRG